MVVEDRIILEGVASNRDEAPDYRRFMKPVPMENGDQVDDRVRYLAALQAEAKSRYEEFAKIADGEGLRSIAKMFRSIMKEQMTHSKGFDHARDTAMNLRTAMAREESKIETIKSVLKIADTERDRDMVMKLQGTLSGEEEHIQMLESALMELEREIEVMEKPAIEEHKPKKFSTFGITVMQERDEDRDWDENP